MKEQEFRDYLNKRGLSNEAAESSINAVKEFEADLRLNGKNLDSATLDDLKHYITLLINSALNTPERLLALTRYFWLTKRNDFYLHFAAVLGGRGVYESISERLEQVAGKEKREEVFNGFVEPPLGSLPEAYPACTKKLLDRLNSSLPMESVQKALAGNHHRIPAAAYAEMKKRYEAAETTDDFLVGEHKRLVDELEETMKSGRLWYEQEITPEVVEFVRGDQRIQNGVREGDVIIKTKIPFNPSKWLKENDPKTKRYYSCHCQLARDAILNDTAKPLGAFCYCSAGYEKYPLEVVLGIPLEVEVQESVLNGDDQCKFAVKIPKDKLK